MASESVTFRARGWAGTGFPIEDETIEGYGQSLFSAAQEAGGIVWFCLNHEISPDTLNEHAQFAAYFSQSKSLVQVKTIWPGAHLEPFRSSPMQNWVYCHKKESQIPNSIPLEFGKQPRGAGKRTDWEGARDTIRAAVANKDSPSKTQESLYESHLPLWVRHQTGLLRILSMEERLAGTIERVPPKVYIFHGVTGSGKTRMMHSRYPNVYVVPVVPKNSSFWADGYHGQTEVGMDEMPWEGLSLQTLLGLLDRYPLSVPVKGGFVQWRPETVCLTSNLHPDEWYPGADPRHLQAFRRRVTGVVHFEIPLDTDNTGANWATMNQDMTLLVPQQPKSIPAYSSGGEYGNFNL